MTINEYHDNLKTTTAQVVIITLAITTTIITDDGDVTMTMKTAMMKVMTINEDGDDDGDGDGDCDDDLRKRSASLPNGFFYKKPSGGGGVYSPFPESGVQHFSKKVSSCRTAIKP